MGFELRYPVGLTTNTFIPNQSFDVTGSGQERDDQAIGKPLDRLLYTYRVGSAPVWRFRRKLAALTQANMTALETFLAAAGNQPFEFTDGTCGPVTGWQKVKLDPDSFVRQYSYAGGQRQAVELVLREEP